VDCCCVSPRQLATFASGFAIVVGVAENTVSLWLHVVFCQSSFVVQVVTLLTLRF